MSIALTAVMAASLLAGCGGSGASGSSSSGDTFKIGVIGPLTGGAAAYGNAVQYSAQIAVDEINAAGGINGKQVELKAEDDELDAQKSVNAYNSHKDWGMDMLVGCVTSACSIAVS